MRVEDATATIVRGDKRQSGPKLRGWRGEGAWEGFARRPSVGGDAAHEILQAYCFDCLSLEWLLEV